MAYWWVSQNQTFPEESGGGYLWAPQQDKAGRCPHHWRTMLEVRPGDVIFSYVGQQIVAVAQALSHAQACTRPVEFRVPDQWEPAGWRIEARYQPLHPPLPIAAHLQALQPLLTGKYSPLTAAGSGNQGYLFRLPPAAGHYLLSHLPQAHGEFVETLRVEQAAQKAEHEGAFDPKDSADARAKTLAAIVRRRGQPAFRKALLEAYEGRCTLSGCAVAEVLEAAHIYPYRGEHTHHISNGLLLRADLHTLFDLGLIAIDSGSFTVIIAAALKATSYEVLAGQALRLPAEASKHPSKEALDWHRKAAGL